MFFNVTKVGSKLIESKREFTVEKQSIVDNLSELGRFFDQSLRSEKVQDPKRNELVQKASQIIGTAHHKNAWFTEDAIKTAFAAWSEALKKDRIENWLSDYSLDQSREVKKVGVIMAGNIPMVGLHDAISVLISGHELLAKLSSKDEELMKLCLEVLAELDKEWNSKIKLVEQLKDAEMLIATGNDNSARYFEYYFKDKPRIIRKNRTALAVLSDSINDDQLDALADDVFIYFGLGCRNVTKVYLPEGFDLDRLFKAFYKYKEIAYHNQYANNYDYNKAVYLMNSIELRENGFLLLKEDEGIHSPLGVLFYEYYNDLEQLETKLDGIKDQTQLIVSDLDKEEYKQPGVAQIPELTDYADGVDTLDFLLKN